MIVYFTTLYLKGTLNKHYKELFRSFIYQQEQQSNSVNSLVIQYSPIEFGQ